MTQQGPIQKAQFPKPMLEGQIEEEQQYRFEGQTYQYRYDESYQPYPWVTHDFDAWLAREE
uniref:Uncharacterized protein n=1 Tax=Oryza punctata TaxID=4537 RepID=A0A0E0LBD8_ORYPU